MPDVPVRELRNNTAAVIERVRLGEQITITVNGVPAAQLTPIERERREFLTVADLMALRPRPGSPVPEYWEHELEGDTTDDLGTIE